MRLKIIVVVLLLTLCTAGIAQAFSGLLLLNVTTDGGAEGSFFDVHAETQDVLITGFETVLVGTANVRVYYKPGSYAGSETSPAAWTLLGSQTMTGGSGFIQTLYPVNIGGVVVPAGETYGFLIYSGFTGTGTLAIRSHGYATGSASDGVITLTSGSASFDGDAFSPFDGSPRNRTWRGVVHYTTDLSDSFADGRINRFDPAAAFAVYPHWDAAGELGLIFYDTYADRLLLVVSAAEIAAVPDLPAENTLIAASPDGRVSLYRLFDGQFQAMGPAASGKQYGVIFPVIDSGTDYDSFEE